MTGDRRFLFAARTPTGRKKIVRAIGYRITADKNFRSVDVLYHLCREHVRWCSGGHDLSPIQQYQSVTILGGKVQVVEYGDHRHAGLTVQVPYQVEDGQLMPDVKMTCWFIQKEYLRLLGEAHGDECPLALAPTDFRDWPVGNVRNIGEVHGTIDDCQVLQQDFCS